MTVRHLVIFGIALWFLGLSLQTLAQDTPAKVDVVAVAGSAWTGLLTVVLPIVVTCLITVLGLLFKHRADMRTMEQLHLAMAADRKAAEEARLVIERRQDEDRAEARAIAAEERAIAAEARAEARRVAQRTQQAALDARMALEEAALRVERVKTDLVETTASAAAAVTETRDRLTTLVVASEKNAAVTGQIGELAAAMHSLGNSAEDLRLSVVVDRATVKAQSGIKTDVDALEKAAQDLEDHRAKQLVVDTQGGKGQAAGEASIKKASTELAAGTTKPKEDTPT